MKTPINDLKLAKQRVKNLQSKNEGLEQITNPDEFKVIQATDKFLKIAEININGAIQALNHYENIINNNINR